MLSLSLAACNSSTSAPVVTAIHDLHQPLPTPSPLLAASDTMDFYRLPFPNDVRTLPSGLIDFTLYPRPLGLSGPGPQAIYTDVIASVQKGYGTSGAAYFRFSDDINPSALPATAEDSITASASAFIVDVTVGSPTYGQRSPVLAHYVSDAYVFIGPHWMALLPFPGRPLRGSTTYAAVVTDAIGGAKGEKVVADADFTAAMGPHGAASKDAAIAKAAQAYAPLAAWLATKPTLAGKVVNAAVFTTVDIGSLMSKIRADVYSEVPAPTLDNLSTSTTSSVNQLYEATYQGANYQVGTPPYTNTGGQINLDSSGNPHPTRMETMRLAISPPLGPMPSPGWPVVIYAHGTGGDYHDFIGDGSATSAAAIKDDAGNVVAKLAMVGIDQVLAGTRAPPGTDQDSAFFNLSNILAARDNPHQGALDNFQLTRLLSTVNMVAGTGQTIKFDATKFYFKGHSEGSLTGGLFLGVEPGIKGAILSGAGANFILSLLSKMNPVNVAAIVQGLFDDPVDEYHPFLSLLQTYLEDSDSANYGRWYFTDPPSGFSPKSIYQSFGIVDTYAPIPTLKAMALSMGVQPVGQMLEPIDGLDLTGQSWTAWAPPPVSGNVAGGMATGVVVQYDALPGSDGHFVATEVPAAIFQCNGFLGSMVAAANPTVATLPSPPP